MIDTKFCENRSGPFNFRRIRFFLFFLFFLSSVQKPKSSNVLSQKNNFVKSVRKQYENLDSHPFFLTKRIKILTISFFGCLESLLKKLPYRFWKKCSKMTELWSFWWTSILSKASYGSQDFSGITWPMSFKKKSSIRSQKHIFCIIKILKSY